MGARFPAACRLSDSERTMLQSILADTDSPCVDCAWQSTCTGFVDEQKREIELTTEYEGKCLICGHGADEKVCSSKLISGTFHFCDECEDEYVFDPLEAPVEDSSAEAIDF